MALPSYKILSDNIQWWKNCQDIGEITCLRLIKIFMYDIMNDPAYSK